MREMHLSRCTRVRGADQYHRKSIRADVRVGDIPRHTFPRMYAHVFAVNSAVLKFRVYSHDGAEFRHEMSDEF